MSEAKRREFVEWIYHEALTRQMLQRYFRVELEPIKALDVLEQLVDLELAELVEVDASANDFGAGRMFLLKRSRPEAEAKEARASRVRKAEQRILEEIRERRRQESRDNG